MVMVSWIVNVVNAGAALIRLGLYMSFQLVQVLAHKLELSLVNFSPITNANTNKYYLIETLCSCLFLQSNHSTKFSLDRIA